MSPETAARTGKMALGACALGFPTLGLGFAVAVILGAMAVRAAFPHLKTTEGSEQRLYQTAFYAGTAAATFGVFLPTMTVGAYVFWDVLIWWK